MITVGIQAGGAAVNIRASVWSGTVPASRLEGRQDFIGLPSAPVTHSVNMRVY